MSASSSGLILLKMTKANFLKVQKYISERPTVHRLAKILGKSALMALLG